MSQLQLPNNPNSSASQRYKKRHNIKSDDKKTTNKSRNRKKLKKKNKNQLPVSREEAEAPKSFIIVRGRVTKYCKFLRDDLRLVFSPYTAAKLREKQSNALKDFIVSASEFGVTHLMTLSQSDISGTMLRMIRLPKGPTFWFQIKEYSLIQDVMKMKAKHKKHYNKKWNSMKHNKTSSFLPHHIQFSLRFAPLVILNGFSVQNTIATSAKQKQFNPCTDYHKKLMAVMFKHMFCPLNVVAMKLTNCKRVVLFNYDSQKDVVQIRHYKIQIANKVQVAKKIKGGVNLDLSQYEDIKDFVMEKNANANEKDGTVTDDENTKIIIDQIKSNNSDNSSCFIRLKEIGPRIDMELVKIEELVNDGKVLYHRYITKTKEEIEALQKKKDEERQSKQQRVVRQQLNVTKKMQMKKEKANKRIENRKQKEVEELLAGFQGNQGEPKPKKEKTESILDMYVHLLYNVAIYLLYNVAINRFHYKRFRNNRKKKKKKK
eukprot:316852_1